VKVGDGVWSTKLSQRFAIFQIVFFPFFSESIAEQLIFKYFHYIMLEAVNF